MGQLRDITNQYTKTIRVLQRIIWDYWFINVNKTLNPRYISR